MEDVGNKTGCLKGKCNNGSDNGIYVSQNRLVLGNTNKSIILIKKYSKELGINPAHWSNAYMGDVLGNLLEKNFAIKKGLKVIKTDKGWSTDRARKENPNNVSGLVVKHLIFFIGKFPSILKSTSQPNDFPIQFFCMVLTLFGHSDKLSRPSSNCSENFEMLKNH